MKTNNSNLSNIINNIPNNSTSYDLSEFFKIYGDFTRIRLLFAIKNVELSVKEISSVLNMQQSAISHQLKILRQYKLVSIRKDGKNSFYSLNDKHIFDILEIALEHISHN